MDFDDRVRDPDSMLRWQSRNQCLPADAVVSEGFMSVEVKLYEMTLNFIPDDKEELDYLKSKMKKG